MPSINGRRKRDLPLSRLMPNLLTILGLCAGLSAMRYALLERWEMAVGFIVIAMLIDGIDGKLARWLDASSTFGAQLDSLADFLNFGVAPVFLLYVWKLENIRGGGWAIVLFFSTCCALRLARFNTMAFERSQAHPNGKAAEESAGAPEEETPDHFFIGVPAPAGAGLTLLPILMYFEFGDTWIHHPWILAPYTLGVAILMASRLPTLSMKRISIRQDWLLPLMLGMVGIVTFAVIEPWLFLIVCTLCYMATLPLAWRMYGKA